MMDRDLLEAQLSELPLYVYTYIDPKALEFSSRIRLSVVRTILLKPLKLALGIVI